MNETDLELLARYARYRAEDDFAELVRRHLDLVHSAALRHVRSPQIAEEVAQSVFLKLARHAGRLAPGTILSAWLYQVTRREAIDFMRKEARRQMREQIASELYHDMNAPAAEDWRRIEPLLDQGMDSLRETDRAAILLRFFENKSLQEVGHELGISDDTAQKRVSRAVERLRAFFVRHGVTIGTSGLSVAISAYAVQAAPVGLALTISTASVLASATLVSTATAAATKAIVMTTLNKGTVAATLLGALGTGIYQTYQASTLRDQVQVLEQQQVAAAAVSRELARERDAFAKELAAVRFDLDAKSIQAQNDAAELHRLRQEMGALRESTTGIKPTRNQSLAFQPASEDDRDHDEEMKQLGLAASRGDFAALERLQELVQTSGNGRTNGNPESIRGVRIAFKVLGEEVGKGNDTAFDALWRATRMKYLQGMAIVALGQAAGMGNEKALEPLLDPKRYLLTTTTAGALVPAAQNGNTRAIECLAAIAHEPKKQAEWMFVANGLEKAAASGNATAIDALAAIGRAENVNLRTPALKALENAAFNKHPKALEALRNLGYQ